jgi:hypothetical protein
MLFRFTVFDGAKVEMYVKEMLVLADQDPQIKLG